MNTQTAAATATNHTLVGAACMQVAAAAAAAKQASPLATTWWHYWRAPNIIGHALVTHTHSNKQHKCFAYTVSCALCQQHRSRSLAGLAHEQQQTAMLCYFKLSVLAHGWDEPPSTSGAHSWDIANISQRLTLNNDVMPCGCETIVPAQ